VDENRVGLTYEVRELFLEKYFGNEMQSLCEVKLH